MHPGLGHRAQAFHIGLDLIYLGIRQLDECLAIHGIRNVPRALCVVPLPIYCRAYAGLLSLCQTSAKPILNAIQMGVASVTACKAAAAARLLLYSDHRTSESCSPPRFCACAGLDADILEGSTVAQDESHLPAALRLSCRVCVWASISGRSGALRQHSIKPHPFLLFWNALLRAERYCPSVCPLSDA